tara:strand:+ start:2475 stop:2894 length:420 start_codon:yes stop_codon:yes gene_type:complete
LIEGAKNNVVMRMKSRGRIVLLPATQKGDVTMRVSKIIFGLVLMAATTSPAIAHANKESHPVVRSEPIAGVYNKFWYNYLADVLEADKELKSDLRRATDEEDKRDAWEEYEHELVDADKDYVEEMRDRNYRVGRVTVGN